MHPSARVHVLGFGPEGAAAAAVCPSEKPLVDRVARVLDCIVLEMPFARPADFDLAAYWRTSIERLEAELHPNQATVRLSVGIEDVEDIIADLERGFAAV